MKKPFCLLVFLSTVFLWAPACLAYHAPVTTWDDFRVLPVDFEGNLYVTDNHRVQKFTSDGTFVMQWGEQGNEPGQFQGPVGITASETGDVYVVDSVTKWVQKFTKEGSFLTRWIVTDIYDGSPNDVAIGPGGKVYVSGLGFFKKYSSDGQLIAFWCTFFDGGNRCLGHLINDVWSGNGVAVDRDYFIYVTNRIWGEVHRVEDGPVPVQHTTWGRIKAKYPSGP